MPKIGTINLLYGDVVSNHEIHYKKGEGFYIKGLSSEFLALTEFKTDGYETERGLSESVRGSIKLYKKLKTTSRLVIIYRFSASSELSMNKVGIGSYSGTLRGVSEKIQSISGETFAIGLTFKVAQLIDNGVDRKKYYEIDYETKEMSSYPLNTYNETYQEMDFNEDRYAFFHGIARGLGEIVISASKFFGAKPEQAIKFIENKQKLLS